MKVFGICRNCYYCKTEGNQGKAKHLFCAFKKKVLDTLRLKACPHYIAIDKTNMNPFNMYSEPTIMKELKR